MRGMAASSGRSEIVALWISVAAIILFVATAGQTVPDVLAIASGSPTSLSGAEQTTLLLNIALLLFSWRRYADLRREVTARGEAENRAVYLATRDPLTGLLNRGSITESGTALINQAKQGCASAALCIVDLHRFKYVNDVYGHPAGDSLLCSMAEAIVSLMPEGSLCARLGGDEFAVTTAGDGAAEAMAYLAEQLAGRLKEPFGVNGFHVHISASIGLARLHAGCTNMEALLRQGDIALSAAKKKGRGHAVWFTHSMESELRVRSEIEEGLRRGIPQGQFVPVYQPQVELATGELKGFEMLARWQHPTLGIVEPDVFIPVSEEIGLIGELSESLMHQAFDDAKHWERGLSLSVNISPVQLTDPWLPQKILKLLTETGFPAERLEVEITESSLFENLSLAQNIVASLKNQRIRLSLDDFGTGYSSLAHLRALPFDRIKIDRTFVQSMMNDAESGVIVNAITKLAQSLGVPLTAEGIEDAATNERLIELGCDTGQGWYFGKPLSAAAVQELLVKEAPYAPAPVSVAAKPVSSGSSLTGTVEDARNKRALQAGSRQA